MKKLSHHLLADTVLTARKKKNLTQQELADLTGMNRSILSNLENQTYTPSIEQLEKLGEVLEFDPTDMFLKTATESAPKVSPLNIAVAGTGYVGLSIATLLAQHNHVTAIDIIPEKVEKINHKISPIQDDYIEMYLSEKDLDLTCVLNTQTFDESNPAWAAYREADYVIIAAPTNDFLFIIFSDPFMHNFSSRNPNPTNSHNSNHPHSSPHPPSVTHRQHCKHIPIPVKIHHLQAMHTQNHHGISSHPGQQRTTCTMLF